MWSYQACTEMVMPFCYDGINDMFEKSDWDIAAYTAQCQEMWGPEGVPRPELANSLYGGRNLDSATNIVFTNGLLDPWSSGGVLKSSETKGGVVAIIIPEVNQGVNIMSLAFQCALCAPSNLALYKMIMI